MGIPSAENTVKNEGYKDMKQKVFEILESSMLTGVPEIVRAPTAIRKVIKSVVFVACIAGFVYQASEFMKIYNEFLTVIDIQVTHQDIVGMPAITICNNNGLIFHFLATADFKIVTAFYSWESTQRYLYCPSENKVSKTIPLPHIGDGGHSIPPEIRKLYGHQLFPFLNITSATALPREVWNDPKLIMDHVISSLIPDAHDTLVLCHTLFSVFSRNTTETYKVNYDSGVNEKTTGVVKLFSAEINYEGWEYFQVHHIRGAQIAVHSPTEMVNPFSNGASIQAENFATLEVTITEYNLLPSPFESNCFDYKADWEKNGGPRPLSREMCVEDCSVRKLYAACGCTSDEYLYPHDLPHCATETEISCIKGLIKDFENKCRQDCLKPCQFTVYDFSSHQRKISDDEVEDERDFRSLMNKNKGKIEVYLTRPEAMVLSYRSKFEEVEVFSYVGGYIGMWLGISLIAVFDFIESMVLLSKFICMRCFTRGKKRQRTTRMARTLFI